MAETIHHTCTLCEAGCGLTFEVADNRIQSVRPDEEDVFSKGFVCPKGVSIADLENDPDRLRTPVRRDSSGAFQPISWVDAFDLVAERLQAIQSEHGRDAIGIYVGNPIVHNTGAVLLYNGLLRALGSRNSFSAGSQDTSPRNAASYYLYGSSWAIPIPDLDRTDYFLCLGANPYISNGSFLTAPNVRGRMRGIQKRGGKVVVVDPRRTETAREADEHVAILPGGDAAFLLGMVRVLLDRGRVDRDRIRAVTLGWDDVERLLADLPLERAARLAGVEASTIERLALEFHAAPTAVAYSRVGVCNNRHGTLATWATDLLNLAANRLGEIGGALFASPAIDLVEILRLAGADGRDRWRSRVRGLPETYGALPSAAMAEEMETPGPGQIRGFITYAGNPVLSTPNGRRLAELAAELLEQANDEAVAVPEVVIEGGPAEPGRIHELSDLQIAEGSPAENSLGGLENLALGLLRASSPARPPRQGPACEGAGGLPRARLASGGAHRSPRGYSAYRHSVNTAALPHGRNQR